MLLYLACTVALTWRVLMGKLIFTKLNHHADKNFTCGNPSIDKKVRDSYFLTLIHRCYAYEVTTESGIVIAYYEFS